MSLKKLGRAIHDDRTKAVITTLVNDYGFNFIDNRKHLILRGPTGPQIVLGKTSSDGGCWHRVINVVRREIGIDLSYLRNGKGKPLGKGA